MDSGALLEMTRILHRHLPLFLGTGLHLACIAFAAAVLVQRGCRARGISAFFYLWQDTVEGLGKHFLTATGLKKAD